MKVSLLKDRNSQRPSSEGKAMKRLLTDLALGLLVIGCSQRITFQYTISEVFVQWCAMQTVYAFRNSCSEFQCVPGGYSFTGGGDSPSATCQTQSTETSAPVNVPCWKLELCGGLALPVCACSASRCVAQVQLSELFDLTFTGDEATGVTGSSTVLFHRVYSTDN